MDMRQCHAVAAATARDCSGSIAREQGWGSIEPPTSRKSLQHHAWREKTLKFRPLAG
jgi:hypothetical protein